MAAASLVRCRASRVAGEALCVFQSMQSSTRERHIPPPAQEDASGHRWIRGRSGRLAIGLGERLRDGSGSRRCAVGVWTDLEQGGSPPGCTSRRGRQTLSCPRGRYAWGEGLMQEAASIWPLSRWEEAFRALARRRPGRPAGVRQEAGAVAQMGNQGGRRRPDQGVGEVCGG